MVVNVAGKESHGGSGLENLLSASSLAETHISPDDLLDHNEQDMHEDDDDICTI